jgi:hypothetical protein
MTQLRHWLCVAAVEKILICAMGSVLSSTPFQSSSGVSAKSSYCDGFAFLRTKYIGIVPSIPG